MKSLKVYLGLDVLGKTLHDAGYRVSEWLWKLTLKCQWAEELLVSQQPSISGAQLSLGTSSCRRVTFFSVGLCGKTISVGIPLVQLPFTGQLTGLGQSHRDPHSLMIGGKAWRKLHGSDCGGVWCGGAEVSSIGWWSPWVNPSSVCLECPIPKGG